MNPEPTLPEHQSRLLGALTTAAVRRLGGDTALVGENNDLHTVRMARVHDVALIDHPADDHEPRMITCYLTDIENLDTGENGVNGVKFKFDPERLLYALRWKHKAEPADVELTLVRERNPPVWFPYVADLLLGALTPICLRNYTQAVRVLTYGATNRGLARVQDKLSLFC